MSDLFTLGVTVEEFTATPSADEFTLGMVVEKLVLRDDPQIVYTVTDGGDAASGGLTEGEVADLIEAQTELRLARLWWKPMNLGASNLSVNLPAGLKIGFNAQANSAENGWYLSDGAGGVTGSRTEICTAENFGMRVTTDLATYDLANLPNWSGAGALGPLIRAGRISPTVRPESYTVSTADGVNYFLNPDALSLKAALSQVTPLTWMTDYKVQGADSPFQLDVQGCSVSCDTTSGDIIIYLGPHATLVRVVAIEHLGGSGTVTIRNKPGDGIDFETVLEVGQRCLIFPDQAEWHRWDLLPVISSGDADKVLTVRGDINGPEWATPSTGSGSGDVVGPASSTDGRPALFDGTTGKLLKVGATNTADGLVKLDGSATIPDILIPASIARDSEVTSAIAAIPSGGSAGTPSLRALGTSGTTAAAGNDSRLSDARTPTAHAASHGVAGADPLSLSASQISGLPSSPWFGDGSDGDVVISANTTLTRPMFYRNVTVNSGVTLSTDCFGVWVSDTATNNGTISSVGSGTTGAPPNTTVNRIGTGGGNGGIGTGGSSVAGSALGGGAQRRGGTGGTGGAGGSAGAAGGSTGACADSVMRSGWLGHDGSTANSMARIGGGTGGGSGGPSAGAAGGNGGGGGGCVGIVARHMAGSGAVRADGAAGANAPNTNTGGGGGGGGGFAVVMSSDLTCPWTVTANGGAGGTGNGTGAAGAAGGAGTVILLLGAV